MRRRGCAEQHMQHRASKDGIVRQRLAIDIERNTRKEETLLGGKVCSVNKLNNTQHTHKAHTHRSTHMERQAATRCTPYHDASSYDISYL